MTKEERMMMQSWLEKQKEKRSSNKIETVAMRFVGKLLKEEK